MNKNIGIVGMVMGFAFIAYSIISSSTTGLGGFIDTGSVIIVFGGTAAGIIIAYSLDMIKLAGSIVKVAFMRKEGDLTQGLVSVYELSFKVKKNGILSIEQDIKDLSDPFLQRMMQLIVDGTDKETLESVIEHELINMEKRHSDGQNFFAYLGELSPAFGMIGTLIGLIVMLSSLDDASAIGSGMAVALLTTLYGAILANLVFIPISKKLKNISENEMVVMNAVAQGIIDISNGESPATTEEKLKAFLGPKRLEEFNQQIVEVKKRAKEARE